MSTGLAKLPDVSTALLPAAYERAKEALAACQRVDECKGWADKAAAIASYARQADDKTLLNHAVRIQARAVQRCGDLLESFQTSPQGGRPKDNGAGIHPVSQRDAAEQAGMSRFQEKQAVRVASVPRDEFERLVESDDPPTVTQLAQRGTDKRPAKAPPTDFVTATEALGYLRALEAFCLAHDADRVASGVRAYERAKVVATLTSVTAWIRRFTTALEST